MPIHDLLSKIRPLRKGNMNGGNREDELRALFNEISPGDVSGIDLDDDLMLDSGLDSLSCLELLAEVEKRFDVCFPDEHLGGFRTMRQMLEVIRNEKEDRQL